jgi:DNA-binding transcriptional regulator YiaG
MDIAGKIKRWRKTQNLTQKEAAERLNVPLRTLHRWERNQNLPAAFALNALLSIIGKKK